MNSQRILRHLVQIALMAGTMCLLPNVQAKSVADVGALTPVTAPLQELTRDVPVLVAPSGHPWLCVGGKCGGTGTAKRAESFDTTPLLMAPTGCKGGWCMSKTARAHPSMQRTESLDTTPLLMAPNCPHCRPTRNIGQARPAIQPDESFDQTPVLVAPDCGSVTCNWFRFFG